MPARGRSRSRVQSLFSLLGSILVYGFMIAIALIEVLPVLWMFSTSLRPLGKSFDLPPAFLPTSWKWQNYLAVLRSARIDFPLFFVNSLKIALASTFAQLLTCSMAGFAFARLRFPGRDLLFGIFLASMMVPGTVTIIPVYVIISKLRLMDSHAALILPATTGVFGIFLLRQYFMGLPGELMDAARIDGAGFFSIYARIMLPLTTPALSALAVFTFMGSWNGFYGPLLFLRSWNKYTLPIALVLLRGEMGEGDPTQILAAIMLSLLPVLLIFLAAQRYVVRGIALTGLKS